MAVKDAWQIAQEAAEKIPPYLKDDELTVDRFWQKNKDKMTVTEARNLLEDMIEAGLLVKEQRRKQGKGGGRAVVYLTKK